MKELKGKTAFITGGASGIGLGIAKACGKADRMAAAVRPGKLCRRMLELLS